MCCCFSQTVLCGLMTTLTLCGQFPPPPGQIPSEPDKPPDPNVVKVEKILDAYASAALQPVSKRTEILQPLREMGEIAFPAYETILANPKSDPRIVRSAMEVLISMRVDRRFVNLVVDRLADSSWVVRWKALVFLRVHGSEWDTAPVIALMSDKELDVRYEAATVLEKIGGKRDLIAMDAWLKTGSALRDEKEFLSHVKDCRNKLEKRLKNPIPKGFKN
jgi:hypothetical protein